MATLTVQNIVKTGLTPSYSAAAAGGDQYAITDSRTYVHVKNGGGSSITVTINSQKACDQGGDHDLAVSVTNGQERLIGPLEYARFKNGGGYVQITYSGVTSVTIGVFHL